MMVGNSRRTMGCDVACCGREAGMAVNDVDHDGRLWRFLMISSLVLGSGIISGG